MLHKQRAQQTVVPLLAIFLCLALASCGNRADADANLAGVATAAPSAASSDIDTLRALSEAAEQRAHAVDPGATLRQIDIDWDSKRHTLRYTNADSTGEIAVTVTAPGAADEQWSVSGPAATPLAAPGSRDPIPPLYLSALRVSPAEAARAVADFRADCRMKTLTLANGGSDPVWSVFCDVPEGRLMGTVSNQTAAFQLAGSGQPMSPPATATPLTR